MTHTPGPWLTRYRTVSDGYTRYFGLSTKEKQNLLEGHQLITDSVCSIAEATSNAALAKAAPDLLAALEGLLTNAPAPKGIKQDFSYILYLEAARAAIKQAKEG